MSSSSRSSAAPPVALLVGSETTLRDAALADLRDRALGSGPRDFNEDRFDFATSGTDKRAVLTACRMLPVMSEGRVVVADEVAQDVGLAAVPLGLVLAGRVENAALPGDFSDRSVTVYAGIVADADFRRAAREGFVKRRGHDGRMRRDSAAGIGPGKDVRLDQHALAGQIEREVLEGLAHGLGGVFIRCWIDGYVGHVRIVPRRDRRGSDFVLFVVRRLPSPPRMRRGIPRRIRACRFIWHGICSVEQVGYNGCATGGGHGGLGCFDGPSLGWIERKQRCSVQRWMR